MNANATRIGHSLLRLALLVGIAAASLQVAFALRIGWMSISDPQSTTFQRSEAWRLLTAPGQAAWGQHWVRYDRVSTHLKRAVIAAEDSGFNDHQGIDWDALERAWGRNQKAQEQAERRNLPAKLVGGSTITQQLAKNLFLTGERTVLRKAQEMLITVWLELLLDKRRILEIYLNSVEWGEGLFGAEAAARYYFRTGADRLGPGPSARLAVMLPAPKRFERRPDSPFLQTRAAAINNRMGDVSVP